ncbi:amino acid adenylation domain-containing protein [Paraburkholderia steynii]|uniref:Amino acid adenylation domain-containing protein n=1 Tax=Paraburkholderia steynii TaxID=1245441 RepID=A0A7Z7FPD5_9BURK|nr:amino acid adenylation domain-containing protein [Paraburkholderia steynii]SDJ53486.1 amino acid adenylation domain-containing protein [Paraburkholderia steynii]
MLSDKKITLSRDELEIQNNPLLKTIFSAAQQHGRGVAVIDRGKLYSYEELFTKARSFASYLRASGVCEGQIIALPMRREYSYIYSVIGCLINGNSFLPIDVYYPSERIGYMLDDANAAAIVVNSDLDEATSKGRKILDVRDFETVDRFPVEHIYSSRIAYTIYTSGTTGRPKGVPISSAALNSFLANQGRDLDVSHTSRFATTASISFDMSIWEIFMPLAHGASVLMLERNTVIDGRLLGSALLDHRVTHILMTPSMLSIIPESRYPDLKCVISAGEKCHPTTVARWSEMTKFYDAYGASEATIYTTIIKKTPEMSSACVGHPIAGSDVVIIDEAFGILEPEQNGEICIIGESVSDGYYNRKELNADKFVVIDGRRAYRTGDVGYLGRDGCLFYKGRIDRQVKFNGHRIELEEIERVVSDCTLVNSCAAVLHESPGRKSALFLFVVPNVDHDFHMSELRAEMRGFLPAHTMPTRIFTVPVMPITQNGKVDFSKLLKQTLEYAE